MSWQVSPTARAGRRLLPAGHFFVDWFYGGLICGLRWQIVIDFAVQPVTGTNLDRVKTVEYIQLGQRNTGHTGHSAALAHDNRIKPATAALPARNGAKFMTAFTKPLAGFILKLGREWP